MKKLASVGVVLSALLVLAACGGNQSGSSGAMAGMEHGSTGQSPAATGQDLDKAFLQGMVPHHQAAIDMAQAEVSNGKDSRLKEMRRPSSPTRAVSRRRWIGRQAELWLNA